MDAVDIIVDVKDRFAGDPVFLAGSLVAEVTYGRSNAHADVDLFCPTGNVLIAMGQKLIDQGFVFGDRMDRVWYRWLRYDFKRWHTNSLRMQNIVIAPSLLGGVEIYDAEPPDTDTATVISPDGYEVNLVYKLTEGHPTTSLAQVLESFDFGLLATGWDLESGVYRDMRSYLFPDISPVDREVGTLPLMPNKRALWREGFISQYNGLREAGRYAKYHAYGYDMSLVKDDLVTGYFQAADYLTTHYEQDKQMLGHIYDTIARHIEADNVPQLAEFAKQVDFKDALDLIMEALE